MHTTPDDRDLFEKTVPYHDLLSHATQVAFRDTLRAKEILGESSNLDRSQAMSRAVRSRLSDVHDLAAPLIKLVVGSDGDGLCYLVLQTEKGPINVRWGIIPDAGMIRRSSSARSQAFLSQPCLPWPGQVSEDDPMAVPMLTLGYVIAEDYTIAGVDQSWLSAVYICRERKQLTRRIGIVERFQKPEILLELHDERHRLRAERFDEGAPLRAAIERMKRTG